MCWQPNKGTVSVCVCISIIDTHYWVWEQKSQVQSKVHATLDLLCDKAVGKLVYQQIIFLSLKPKLATLIEWEEEMLKPYYLCS